jgi:hypothetical protein
VVIILGRIFVKDENIKRGPKRNRVFGKNSVSLVMTYYDRSKFYDDEPNHSDSFAEETFCEGV